MILEVPLNRVAILNDGIVFAIPNDGLVIAIPNDGIVIAIRRQDCDMLKVSRERAALWQLHKFCMDT